ncbi:TraR/DksA family transcriptional regulator [Vibrio cincinnatiensis]|nr:TraR/DksA family transcriptional regulator [Vibrio metschnikovii]
MTCQFDVAQAVEQEFRDRALAAQLAKPMEQPDEDDEGNRYCLSCGVEIPPERLEAQPTAVRCVSCQTRKESASGMVS